MELVRFLSARDFFAKCTSIDPSNEAAKSALETAEKAHIGTKFVQNVSDSLPSSSLEAYYPKITKDLKVIVRYIDPVRGKGVFAKTDLP
jgi:hypothetical protein